MSLFKGHSNKFTASAKVVDGTLILSLPDAVSPVVWQMDLGKAASSALEIEQTEAGHVLRQKAGNNKKTDIATFTEKDAALNALMTVSEALGQAHGQIARQQASSGNDAGPVVTSPPAAPGQDRATDLKRGGTGSLVAALTGIILLCGVLYLLVSMGPQGGTLTGSNQLSANISGNSAAGGPQGGGVPMDANEFLRNR